MTPDGAERLREELERLTQVERPALAQSVDPLEGRRPLQSLDQRIHRLEASLASAEIVQPSAGSLGRVPDSSDGPKTSPEKHPEDISVFTFRRR